MSQHKGVFEICPLLTGTWVYFFCVSIRNLCIGSEAEILFQLLIYRIRGLWKLTCGMVIREVLIIYGRRHRVMW